VAVVVASTAGWALLTFVEGGITRVPVFDGLQNRPDRGETGAVNYLLVGSDRREGLSRADIGRLKLGDADGQRADVMILVHVSRKDQKAVLLSFPRDSYVEIPAYAGKAAARDKLNAAYSRGGPTLAVATIEHNTGVRIDHYLEVNFAGFEKIVNAVGGVDVCTPRPLRDRKAGLDLPKGSSRLDGEKGVAYVRARSVDGRGDIGRIERQQRLLASIVKKATSSGVLLNPAKLTALVNAVLDATRTDPGLRRDELLTLATKLRTLSPANVQFVTVPLADIDHVVPQVGSTVLWDEAAAQAMFEEIRRDRPLGSGTGRPAAPRVTVAPADIRVRVLNGAGVEGLGARAAKDLADAGYAVRGSPRNADTGAATQTLVRYDTRYTESVKTLQAALPGARVQPVEGLGRTLEVIVGSSYDGVRKVTVAKPSPSSSGPPAPARTAADDVCR
jgi:LCP family protein required for cell wall assembly